MGKISQLRLHKKMPDGVTKQELDVLQGTLPTPLKSMRKDDNSQPEKIKPKPKKNGWNNQHDGNNSHPPTGLKS